MVYGLSVELGCLLLDVSEHKGAQNSTALHEPHPGGFDQS